MANWEWSDDPNDPCAYCVHWGIDESPWQRDEDGWIEFDVEQAVPLNMDGEPIPRIWRNVHRECNEAVMALMQDSS